MAHKDDRNRPHLRLVVNNPELRNLAQEGSTDEIIPLDELISRRAEFTAEFYQGLGRRQTKVCRSLEEYFASKGWPYGLDPHHGQILAITAASVCPAVIEYVESPQAELLVYLADDASGDGFSLSVEMILPFFSDDESVMEDAMLFAPIFQYGTLFLEENRRDGLLDLIYRLSFPLYPAAPTRRLFERFFSVAAFELTETLKVLGEYPEF